ncbi:MAG: glycosyl hydrolase family 8 [Bacteroidales bacterium]|nr:glycosyl hydrolase family 8 [Bacteroidales bacterium]
MRKNGLFSLLIAFFIASQAFAQSIATGYTVGTWSGFRTAAATFTFDDDAPSHISVVAPEFDSRGYNATFNVVVNWMNQANQWTAFQKLAAKGHEIASHTVTHSENTPSSELSSSKTTINQKITGQDCNTIAYPYCNVPSDAAALAANYIGGRICDGQVMGKTPSDYFRISAITTGSEAGFASASNFTSSMQSAISKGGWVVFLTHGITGETNGNATYSPTPISAITGALDWAKENDSKVWVATFRDAILYAKERDALSLSEKTVSSTSYQLTASVNISSTVVTYDYPITVRRVMPASWKNIAVATGGKDIEVKTVTVGSTVYAQFDVVPGKTYSLEDRASEYTKEGPAVAETTLLNLLENGEFDEGTSYWDTQVGGDAKCTLTATTTAGMSGANAIQLCPNGNYGTENWHIQMYQNVELEGDVEYTLSFSAKASTARKLYVMVQKIAADYDTYLYKEYDLTTTAQNFEETLLTPSDVALDSKVTFCIGGSDGCVTIDNVFFGTEKSSNPGGGDEGGDKPSYSVDVTGDISQYFVDKAYIGPSCDVLPGEEVTSGAYYTGEYTNLFVKYLGKTEAQVQAKMKSVWDHFYTPGGANTVYYEVGSDMAYIYDTGNQDVRTEGQSYGLMICVQMGDREKFDRLWRWAKKYMQYKAGDAREGLFAWQCETNGTIKGASSAPDGEMYFLTALFFASHRWGNDGDINYEEEAQYLAKCLLNKKGRGNGQVSPLFNQSNYLVTFGETSYDFSDPSYNLPGFLELWARWVNTNTSFWEKTPKAARDLLYNSAHKITGLYPDYCNFDGSGYYPNWAGYNTSIYKYDAIRCPMNVGMDYHWFAADSRQETMMYNILNFFKNDKYTHAYFNVDGTGADGYYSEGQKGGNGVGVFALTAGNEALAKENLQKLWDVTPPSGQWRYYNGMVYMLSMLHATGNFRIFKPTPEVVEENLTGPAPIEFDGVEYSKDTTFKKLVDCKIYDVTITIEESSSSFNVIFEDYDGTELKTEVVESGASATAPDEPTRIGYTFKEWDTDFSNVTEDLTVKAVYEINTYTVTFVDFDGTTIDEQTIEYGSDAVAPTEPTREGYDFDGWDVAFTSITKDLTVTATYTEKVAQTTLKYEAENATGSGTTTANSSAASGGKYVKMQSGDLTFNVNVEKAGVYDITVAYSLTEDYKAQNLVVNGVQAGTLAFDKSGSTNPTFATIVAAAALEAGANTIAITKSWGWVDIDYIELSTHESVRFNIDANPVVANPTSGAVELYDFLKKNFGKKTISGVMTLDMPSNNSFKGQYDVSYIHDKSGKYTALVGFDFMQSVGKGTDWATNYTKTMIDITKELWNEGGIPYYTWHWRDPTKNSSSFNTSEVSFSLKDAFTDASCTKWNTNSTLYKGIIADLDVVAKHLLDLQEAGVAVLWRPLHEASGKWFWWGAQGAQPYKQLYYLLFDKLTNEYGLHNLIWVWNTDGTDADWYPGDNYVDIAGRDFYYQAPNTYNHSSLVTEFEAVAKVVDGKKIVTLAECGAVPYPQNMEDDGAMWSWFMPWYDEGTTKYVSSNDHNKASDWDLIMNDERVITLEDMPGWGSVVETPKYTVTFVDYDGTVLDEQTIEEGESAVAPEEPTREGYIFSAWEGSYENVTKDVVITATYTAKDKADYTALNKAIADVEALETVGYTAATVKSLQDALAAAKAVDTDLFAEDQSIVDDATKALTDAMSALAVQTFTVTFVDYDGSTIDEQTVEYAQSAIAPKNPVREGYTFSEWDVDFTNVSADITVKATYTKNQEETPSTEVTVLIDANKDNKAISPYLYAMNGMLNKEDDKVRAVEAGIRLTRENSGNNSTCYNWRLKLTTHPDWYNNVEAEDWDAKAQTLATDFPNIQGMFGFQLLGYAATTREFNFPDWEYNKSQRWEGCSKNFCGNGSTKGDFKFTEGDVTLYSKPWPADSTVGILNHWSNDLKLDMSQFVYWDMDNEPEIWGGTHDAFVSYNQDMFERIMTNYFAVAKKVRQINPNIKLCGPVAANEWSWYVPGNIQPTYNGKSYNWLEYFILRCAEEEKATGVKMIDVFDLHFYPNDTDHADILQTHRALYDTEFDYPKANGVKKVSGKWDNSITKEMVIPRCQEWIDKYFGEGYDVTFGVSEYGVSEVSSNSAMIYALSYASMMGEGARNGMEFFIPWYWRTGMWETVHMFGRYAKDVNVAASSSNEAMISAYTSVSSAKDSMTVIVVNRDPSNALTVNSTITNFDIEDGEYDVYVLSNLPDGTETFKSHTDNALVLQKAVVADGVMSVTVPAYSISAVILAAPEKEEKEFTVTFVADEQIIETQTVTEGKSAKAPEEPVKTGYEFVEWDTDFTNVVEDLTVTAVFKIKTFTVTFVDYDGTTIDEQTIDYGQSAIAPKDPIREGYVFSAWEGSYENVTEDVVITATYTEKDKADYTALNKAIADAEALETVSFTTETIKALQDALTAAKAVDTDLLAEDQTIVDAATKALTDAMANLSVQTFTVTFVDYDGSTIDEQTIDYGQSAIAPKDPAREGYTFSGWIGDFESVTADVTIEASYTEKGKADYTALNNAIVRAESVKTESYTSATVAVLLNALTAAKAVDKNLLEEEQSVVDAATKALNDAMDALAVQVFTVTFVDYDGSTIDKQTVEYGENAKAPADPTREGFVFAGWDGSYETVTADATITATYTAKTKADYTALNNAIAEAEVIETSGYTPATVSKLQSALNSAMSVDKNLYAEDQAVIDVATKALTNAINALTVQTFTVTFVDFNGKTIDEQTVVYGESAIEPSKNPVREGYEFVGWIGSYENVTADVTIQANYVEKPKANYAELDKAIASATGLKESLYSSDSWKEVQSALENAQSIDRKLLEESQTIVDAAALALNNAMADLVVVDRTVLAGTISKANLMANNASEGYNRGQYPIGSKATLAEAIAKANTVYEKVSVSQSELDKANAELLAAMEQFKASIITADKSFLAMAISNATTALAKADGNTGSGSGQYPLVAVTTLENEIASAQEIYKNATEQSIIDTKTQVLNAAVQAFLSSVNPITVDFAELSTLVAEATELLSTTSVGENSGQYGLLECMELSRAKQTAERMISDNKVTQKEVNKQVIILQNAINAYRASQILAADVVDAVSIQLYTKSHVVVVENANDAIAVYDINGRLISLLDKESAGDYAEINIVKDGVYIVKVGTIAQQIMIQ